MRLAFLLSRSLSRDRSRRCGSEMSSAGPDSSFTSSPPSSPPPPSLATCPPSRSPSLSHPRQPLHLFLRPSPPAGPPSQPLPPLARPLARSTPRRAVRARARDDARDRGRRRQGKGARTVARGGGGGAEGGVRRRREGGLSARRTDEEGTLGTARFLLLAELTSRRERGRAAVLAERAKSEHELHPVARTRSTRPRRPPSSAPRASSPRPSRP